MGSDQRIAELNALARSLDDEQGGGWLARTVRDEVAAEIPEPATPTAAEEIADLIVGGAIGRCLLAELWAKHGSVKRCDVFLGVALASSLLEARFTLAETERNIAVAELSAGGSGSAAYG